MTGFGGVGKTALALWFTLQLYDKRRFEYIVSASARDRALTTKGISQVRPTLTSFDQLLDEIAKVLGFSEEMEGVPLNEKERYILDLLDGTETLLLLDNLETVDDERIIDFVEKLPLPARAIVTARRERVRKSVYPISVGSLEEHESLALIGDLVEGKGRDELAQLSLKERQLIAGRCLNVPLAIEWVIGRAARPSDALDLSRELERYSASTDELLDFSFRRVHQSLSAPEQPVLNAIAVFQNPQPVEALSEGANLSIPACEDAIEGLRSSHLIIERRAEASPGISLYDANTLVKRFAYAVLSEQAGQETAIRQKLSSWYDALDIKDTDERAVVSEIRKGKREPEQTYVQLGTKFRRTGQYSEAERCLKTALGRNPTSWQAHRAMGELYREQSHLRSALESYELAARYAPKKGPDRALIYREWGMLIRRSGTPDAGESAAEKLETALRELPNDRVCAVALAQVYERRGYWKRIVELLQPLVDHEDPETRRRVRPLLLKAYQAGNDILRAAELRQKIQQSRD